MEKQKTGIRIKTLKFTSDNVRWCMGCRKYHFSRVWYEPIKSSLRFGPIEVYCKKRDAENIARHIREEVKK